MIYFLLKQEVGVTVAQLSDASVNISYGKKDSLIR